MRPVPSAAESVADAARNLRFEQRVLPHLDAAYGLARWLARAEHDAEDVLQEAMLRAYRYYDSGSEGNTRAWLLTVVRNTFYTLHKQATALRQDEFDEAIHDIADDAPTPEAQLLRDADVRQLRDAIETLPLEYREVLVLREFEECSYKDIAEITGLKLGTVMSRLARARDRLAQTLGANAQGEPHHVVQ
jgi:RNA polymerase sigma-70 factor (ECF subfamily)